MKLYLVERGPKHEGHRAPFHPVIVCAAWHTARWEAGGSPDGGTVWSCEARKDGGGRTSWFMLCWKGLEIWFRGVSVYFTLPDGSSTRSHCERAESLLSGAVWWSPEQLPDWLKALGVVEAEDEFSQTWIEDDPGLCPLSESRAEKIRERRGKEPHHAMR